MVGLALLAVQALQTAIAHESEFAAVAFLVCAAAVAGMFGAALLGRMPSGRMADFWPVRMVRLWMEGTERKLKQRAGQD